MYTIYVDDTLLYSPERVQDGYVITAGKLTREVNKADSLDLTIPGSNPGLSHLTMMGSRIVVFRDENVVFIGRALTAKRGLYNLITYHCEGGLAFYNDVGVSALNDITRIPRTYIMSLHGVYDSGASYIPYTGSFMNAYIPHFVPHCDGRKPSNFANDMPQAAIDKYFPYTETRGYSNTALERFMIRSEEYGGTVVVEYTNELVSTVGPDTYDDSIYITKLHWYESGKEPLNPQVVQFGNNLLDIAQSIDYSRLRTVYYPVGFVNYDDTQAQIEVFLPKTGAGVCHVPSDRYNAESTAPSGGYWPENTIYIPDTSAVEQYGFIMENVDFDLNNYHIAGQSVEVGSPEYVRLQGILLREITSYAEQQVGAGITFSCRAIDKNIVDSTETPLCVGQRNRVISPPNNVDTTVLCNRTEEDLLDPTRSRYTFGTSAQMLSSLLKPNSSIAPGIIG